uniref:Uncharacterized protein n=1 Tax=Arundo donax TaxID=35708 RepID=A0A0A9EM32_ARUDO
MSSVAASTSSMTMSSVSAPWSGEASSFALFAGAGATSAAGFNVLVLVSSATCAAFATGIDFVVATGADFEVVRRLILEIDGAFCVSCDCCVTAACRAAAADAALRRVVGCFCDTCCCCWGCDFCCF